jgi:hypothetical protein
MKCRSVAAVAISQIGSTLHIMSMLVITNMKIIIYLIVMIDSFKFQL